MNMNITQDDWKSDQPCFSRDTGIKEHVILYISLLYLHFIPALSTTFFTKSYNKLDAKYFFIKYQLYRSSTENQFSLVIHYRLTKGYKGCFQHLHQFWAIKFEPASLLKVRLPLTCSLPMTSIIVMRGTIYSYQFFLRLFIPFLIFKFE